MPDDTTMPISDPGEDLRAALPPDCFREVSPGYLSEPRGHYRGVAARVLAPSCTAEVATALRICNAHRAPVIPYGGGTGLVGGQISEGPARPVVLSLERMNAIRAVYPQENVLIAEGGAILADIQGAAEAADRLFPLSLASEGSCRIGGNLATNAGGTGVLRYGNARDLCLGLEAVLPDGSVWNGLRRLRKDNTGYDLRNLLIGSEGTLGVITAATLKLFSVPAGIGTAMIAVPSPAAALALLALARGQVGDCVSAFELIHRQGIAFLEETGLDPRAPFDVLPEWCVLVELGLPRGIDPGEALMELFEAGCEAGLALDGAVAQSEAQRAAFWALRETIPEANKRVGAISSHDISVPLGALAGFITAAGERVARIGRFRINCFGHVGDGNLHFNVFPAEGQPRPDGPDLPLRIRRCVHDLVHELGGSVSAEHGIGRLKTGDLLRYGDPVKLSAMRAIKAALDPAGIMNPGALLPM